MPSDVLMLCLQEMDRNDLNLLKIISFLGLKYNIMFLDNPASPQNYLHQLTNEDTCTVINSNALSRLHESGLTEKLKDFFSTGKGSMFVYNISPNPGIDRVLSSLSEGTLQHVLRPSRNVHQYTVSNENIFITRHFHGLSIKPVNRDFDFIFNRLVHQEDLITLISIGEYPFFVKYRSKNTDVFFVANNHIADIDENINHTNSLCTYFSGLIPPVMFLKYVFGDACWHTEQILANFTIDDPLLKKRYGFLNYRSFLRVIDRNNICACIAFIPINYKRLDQNTIRLFQGRSDRFSLCVHGSRHTYGEFCVHDFTNLHNKITLATKRMDELTRITGVPYDKVMVFPQGIFSCNTMKMLKYHNYHAAVNTEILPCNNSIQLKLSDCLEPAIMKYAEIPLFSRRYPEGIEDFAFDSFFGKPLLIVEHHTYFRHGYQKLNDLILRIRTIDSSIRWDNLGSIVKQTYLMKTRKDGDTDIRMYTNPTVLVNTSSTKRLYHIRKTETDHASITEITIAGGKIVSSEKSADNVLIVAEIPPQTRAELTIHYSNSYSLKKHPYRENDSIPTLLRRHLSEIRDNYISKSPFLSSFIAVGIKGINRSRNLLQNNSQLNE